MSARRKRRQPVRVSQSTPRQLIRCVWGLRGAPAPGLTVLGVGYGPIDAMDMDAPDCIPAGSMRRDEPIPDVAFVTETVVIREGRFR